jgi:peptide/nickel transport system substrate-binding protein
MWTRKPSHKFRWWVILLSVLVLIPSLKSLGQDQNSYQEAPMLAERVERGELPSVEERLPEQPLEITPFDAPGQYGGTIDHPFTGSNPGWGGLWFFTGWEQLFMWSPDLSRPLPNIALGYEVNADATVYTIFLREGMRWSDGHPFTADDILFAINDIYLNPAFAEVVEVPMPELTVGGVPVVAEKVDDYAVRLTFAQPYPLLPEILCSWPMWRLTHYPRHWLEPYHLTYNPDGIEALVEAEGAANWVELFSRYATGFSDNLLDYFSQPERPVLTAWVVVEPLGDDDRILMERNPYYFKVDSEGQQLPYVDQVLGIAFPDIETLTLAATSGSFDLVRNPRPEDIGLYQETQSDSGLTLYYDRNSAGNVATILFNRTLAADPVKAAVFDALDFRIGMSYAINRQQIIDVVYFGQGEPYQMAPLPDSPLYNEQMATQYLDYNPELANTYLDRVLPQRDADGFRLRPDGQRLSITLTVADEFGFQWPQLAEMLTQYWQDVGIEVQLELVTPSERDALRVSNEIEATLFTGEGGSGITAMLEPRYFVPTSSMSMYAIGWGQWFSDPSSPTAVEPPQQIIEHYQLYTSALAETDYDTRLERMQIFLQRSAEAFYVIGIATPPARFTPISQDLRNVPSTWLDGWLSGAIRITRPEQWFFVHPDAAG